MSNNCTIASSFISFDLKVLLQAQLLRDIQTIYFKNCNMEWKINQHPMKYKIINLGMSIN